MAISMFHIVPHFRVAPCGVPVPFPVAASAIAARSLGRGTGGDLALQSEVIDHESH
jgi:hypothetical protein